MWKNLSQESFRNCRLCCSGTQSRNSVFTNWMLLSWSNRHFRNLKRVHHHDHRLQMPLVNSNPKRIFSFKYISTSHWLIYVNFIGNRFCIVSFLNRGGLITPVFKNIKAHISDFYSLFHSFVIQSNFLC